MRRVTSIIIFLLLTFGWASAEPELLKFKIETTDGQPAKVLMEGREVGTTGELLEFDITGYRDPLFLDITLVRKRFIPTLYSLEVPDRSGVWQPPPLKILKPAQDVRLRVEPSAQRLYRETKDGGREPAGQNSTFILEVKNLAVGQAFRPTDVVVHLERDGYVAKRLVLPHEVWLSDSFPPEGEPPIKLLAAPGWGAWWTRYSQEKPFVLFAGFGLCVLLGSLAWIRFHYLRKVEAAHEQLSLWVKRLDTFVEGSRELAAPLKVEELAECAALQAKRLCGSDWEAVHCNTPEHHYCSDTAILDKLGELSNFVSEKRHPLRLDDLSSSRFKDVFPNTSSLLGQPLLFKGQYFGMLILGSNLEAKYTATDQEALAVLATQVAASIERIRLHHETVDAYEKLAESEAQLVQSAKMAAVGQLAAGVAHELNTPLSAITFGIEMVGNHVDKQPARAKKRLELVMDAAQRATGIVKKLLYYSREANVDEKDFQLQALVEDTEGFLDFQLKQDGIKLVIDSPEDHQLRGNLNELSQVLSNLILNARDAILKGECEKVITIETRERVNAVEILVKDEAGGVPADIAPRIFDPFFTTKNLGDGTGLGLSVSQKIMEKHGGELRLESAQQPTCFCMRLPKPV